MADLGDGRGNGIRREWLVMLTHVGRVVGTLRAWCGDWPARSLGINASHLGLLRRGRWFPPPGIGGDRGFRLAPPAHNHFAADPAPTPSPPPDQEPQGDQDGQEPWPSCQGSEPGRGGCCIPGRSRGRRRGRGGRRRNPFVSRAARWGRWLSFRKAGTAGWLPVGGCLSWVLAASEGPGRG